MFFFLSYLSMKNNNCIDRDKNISGLEENIESVTLLEAMSFLTVRLSSFDTTLAMAVPIEVLCKECFMREDPGTAGMFLVTA